MKIARTMIACCLTVLVLLSGCQSTSSSQTTKNETASSPTQDSPKQRTRPQDRSGRSVMRATQAKVIELVDGDTLKVQWVNGPKLPVTTIRLIGVDTPEVHGQTEPYGPKASAFAEQHLTSQTVWLTKDVRETDRYDRALRYVWLQPPPAEPSDEAVRKSMFNARLLVEGYARASTHPPDVAYADLFKKLEAQAREQNRGLWKEVPIDQTGSPKERAKKGETNPSTTQPETQSGTSTGPYDPNGPDRDCGDFSSHQDAQAFLEAAGGPEKDPHRLDGDGDGVACEGLP